jgi:anti-sigma B factor antagonist
MSLKAQIVRDSRGNITVHMKGGLDYESSIPLKQEIYDLVRENPTIQIVLDMHFLEFVGSSGIGSFVESLKEINKERTRVFMKNVKPEFLKVFKLYQFENLKDFIMDLEDRGHIRPES